ncbi:imelysin family protein [Curvivirga aplysinae]|uniref:imelysin family protein n=1 Tax=Curvivirga aplysinae TaxID=2529852 RepID=UPI0012BB5471|nr:imelysin family protein [Curvivirga aplysinae]MTI09174.1 hypothetical protein [Curvivirga aplysinae]
MKKTLQFITVVCTALIIGSAFAGQFKETNANYVDQHIFPRTEAFAKEAFEFKETTIKACRLTGAQQQEMLQKAFHEAVDAWQGIEHLRMGPLSDYDQMHRLQFWPDKRNKVSKALSNLQKKQEAGEHIDEQKIAFSSVAGQGFPIFERIIYQDGEISAKQCEILRAVASNIYSIAKSVHQAWVDPEYGYGGEMKFTLAENELYTDELSVTADLFTNLWSALQWVEDNKIRSPLREDISKAKPRRMENWRSARSFKNISIDVAALKDSYETLLQSHVLDLADGAQRDALILDNLNAAATISQELENVKEEGIKSEEIWNKMLDMAVHLKEARGQLFAVAKELSIPVGFNSLDGD